MVVTVGAACVENRVGDLDHNLEAAVSLVHCLAERGAQIAVLPEGCLQGYPVEGGFNAEQARELAEPFDGPYARAFRDAAKAAGIYLVSAYDRRDGDRIFNTAELISPDGETIGIYDKTHTVNRATGDYYTPGAGLPVFDTRFGKVGILICVDRTYAENWRVLMLRGARLVLIPSNGGCSERNTHRLQAMCFDQCLCCAFAHPRRGLVIDVQGDLLDRDGDGEKPFALGEVDLRAAGDRQLDLRRRRRPELYGPVVQPR